MKIVVGENSGFCAGVNHTVRKALELVKSHNGIYCLGEIVHNENVIRNLEDSGMITVADLIDVPDYSSVIFRAHGETKDIYELASSKHLKVYDLVCGKVQSIRRRIQEHVGKDFIIILGKKNHPETGSHFSYAGHDAFIIESLEDIPLAISKVNESSFHSIYVVAQTTFSTSLFQDILHHLKSSYVGEIICDNTICNATEMRQREVFKLASQVDKMIIIGGKNSSNTKELYNIAKSELDDVYLIQSADSLLIDDFSSSDTIGIMGGASTPDFIIDEVIDKLNSYFRV